MDQQPPADSSPPPGNPGPPPYGPPPYAAPLGSPTYPPSPAYPPPPGFAPPTPPSHSVFTGRRILLIVAIIAIGGGIYLALVLRSIRTVSSDVHVPLRANSAGVLAPGKTGLQKTRVTIVSISGAQPTAGTTATRQITIAVALENTGRFEMAGYPWKLRCSDGKEYDRIVPTGAANPLPDSFALSPGSTIQGTITFAVPADAAITWLRYGPNAPLNPNLYFDAP